MVPTAKPVAGLIQNASTASTLPDMPPSTSSKANDSRFLAPVASNRPDPAAPTLSLLPQFRSHYQLAQFLVPYLAVDLVHC